MNHVLVLCVGKDNSPEASEWQCSKVNQPDPTREKKQWQQSVAFAYLHTWSTNKGLCLQRWRHYFPLAIPTLGEIWGHGKEGL